MIFSFIVKTCTCAYFLFYSVFINPFFFLISASVSSVLHDCIRCEASFSFWNFFRSEQNKTWNRRTVWLWHTDRVQQGKKTKDKTHRLSPPCIWTPQGPEKVPCVKYASLKHMHTVWTVRKHSGTAELTNVSMEFICEALLPVSKGAVVITFGDLPHMCVYRDSLSFVQRHQTNTICYLQGANTHSNSWGQCATLATFSKRLFQQSFGQPIVVFLIEEFATVTGPG